MIPPRSPYCLIQEDLWPDAWKIMLSCLLLNRTTRKQVEKVLPVLFANFPDAQSMASADPTALASIIAPLGFKNRRSFTLINFSKCFLGPNWSHASELPGIGEYGSAVWDIFVKGTFPSVCPKDHALTLWWKWHQLHNSLKKNSEELKK